MNYEREILSKVKKNEGVYEEKDLLNEFIDRLRDRTETKTVNEKFTYSILQLLLKGKLFIKNGKLYLPKVFDQVK